MPIPDSNKLISFRAPGSPSIDGVTLTYLNAQWRALESVVRVQNQVIARLENRIAALGG